VIHIDVKEGDYRTRHKCTFRW